MFKSGNVYKRDLSTWLEQLRFIGLTLVKPIGNYSMIKSVFKRRSPFVNSMA